MRLIFIRHAIAKDHEEHSLEGLSDHIRPLTKKGEKQFRKMSKWLFQVEPQIHEIWTSPFLRTRQTTELLKEVYPSASVYERSELEPHKSPSAFIKILKVLSDRLSEPRENHQEDKLVSNSPPSSDFSLAIVGHEPLLSELVSLLVSGPKSSTSISFKKAGMAHVQFLRTINQGELKWLVNPKIILKN